MSEYGGVAHLVERYIRIVEVVGSSPIVSTKTETDRLVGFCFAEYIVEGLEQEGETLWVSEENSSVNCFRRRGRVGAWHRSMSHRLHQNRNRPFGRFLFCGVYNGGTRTGGRNQTQKP